jgi:hypothetical protein
MKVLIDECAPKVMKVALAGQRFRLHDRGGSGMVK